MAKVSKNRKLGLNFGSEDLLLIETEETAKNQKVTALLNVTSELPFSVDMFSQESGAELVGSELRKVLDNNNITTKNVAISLELGLANIIKVPYSKKLNDKELSAHLNWELQQYVDENAAGYAYDSYKLVKSPTVKNPELVLVGARKRVLTFFSDMGKKAGLDLQLINLNLLSAVNTFEANYKFHPKEKIALVEIGERKIIFILLEGNFFIGYHCVYLDDSVHDNFVGSVLDLITLNLKTLFSDFELGTDKSDFEHIFLYRNTTKYSVTQFIEAADREMSMLNPFEKVRLDARLQDTVDYLGDNSEYVDVLGVTLV